MTKIKTEQSDSQSQTCGKDAVIVVVSGHIRCQKVANVSREVLHLTGHAVPGRSSRIFSTTLTAMDMKSFKAKNGSFRRPGVQCLTSQIMYTIVDAFFRAFAGFSRLLPLRAYQVDGASSCGCQM